MCFWEFKHVEEVLPTFQPRVPRKLWLANSKGGQTLKLKVQLYSSENIRFPRSCITLQTQTKVHYEMQEGEFGVNIAGRNCFKLQISGIDFGDFIFQLSFPNMLYLAHRLWDSVPFHGSHSSHQSQALQAGQ